MIDASDWDIPQEWRSLHGALTPSGQNAQFRSPIHAVMAVRIHFLNCHPSINDEPVGEVIDRYLNAWTLFCRHADTIVAVDELVDDNIYVAADLWNRIEQVAVDAVYRILGGEREPRGRVNLSTAARNLYLPDSKTDLSVPREHRDRVLIGSDHAAAWDRARGHCVACGAATIRESRYQHIRRTLADHPNLFDLAPTYTQTSGRRATLWRDPVLLMVKGVRTAASVPGPRYPSASNPSASWNSSTLKPCEQTLSGSSSSEKYSPAQLVTGSGFGGSLRNAGHRTSKRRLRLGTNSTRASSRVAL